MKKLIIPLSLFLIFTLITKSASAQQTAPKLAKYAVTDKAARDKNQEQPKQILAPNDYQPTRNTKDQDTTKIVHVLAPVSSDPKK